MFLPGLVLNANRLMHELRRKGQEIARLQEEREALEEAGKSSRRVNPIIEALYRETDIVAAEVQYVHLAEAAFDDFIAEDATGEPNALVVGLDGPAISTQLNHGSEFSLLQNLAEGAAIWPGFKPAAALDDHREFLNEVLAANDVPRQGGGYDQPASSEGPTSRATVIGPSCCVLASQTLRAYSYPFTALAHDP